MSPDPKPDSPEPASDSTADRLTAVETEQQRQGGLLEQILAKLGTAPGRPQGATGEPSGGSIADLVRQGVEQLRAEEAEQAARDADKTQRADHDARIKALEERPPSETAATPAGKIRSGVQRWVFGEPSPHK